MPKLGNNLDFVRNQALNLKLQNLATDPVGLVAADEGLAWINTTTGNVMYWDGVAAVSLVSVLNSISGTAPIVVGAVSSKNQAVSISAATTGAAGSMSSADKTKLDGVATGATANDANALLAHLAGVETLTGNKTFTGTVALPAGTTGLTKTTVGLANVDNTTDAAKPVSTATSTALGLKADLVAGLVPTSQLPVLVMSTSVVVASQAAMLALTTVQVQPGDLAIRSDGAGTFMLTAVDPSILGNWSLLQPPTDVVTSVNGDTGVVVLAKADVGLSNVDNTSDANKPVSTAAATADALKAPLASPAFTGTPTGITKTHVGLANVDNTSDVAKPVSTAQAAADGLRLLATNNLSDVPSDVTARTNIGAVGKYAANITTNGVLTSCPVIHNLNTTDVQVYVYELATKAEVFVDKVHTDANTVTILFSVAPAANTYRVIVIG